MDDFRYDDEEEEDLLPFEGLEKSAALQACRAFNEVPLNIPVCIEAMTSVLYLVSTGTTLTEAEATDLFFSSTKLLQSSHPKLRRLHYILMKELSPLVEQSFIASNSLMIDIKNGNDSFKANAIRTLYTVMDSSMYNSMDRTIMECMNSKNPNVVMAALVTGIHMSQTNPEMPKKWATQLAEVMKASNNKTQYAGIALLHRIRRNDRLSVERLTSSIRNGMVRSELAVSLVIKMCTEILQDDFEGSKNIYDFVVSRLGDASLMNDYKRQDLGTNIIALEAANTLASLRNVSSDKVFNAVHALNSCWRHNSSVVRFAAVRLLNQMSTDHPTAVQQVEQALEELVMDPNRNIATLATTTVLKTGTEETVERLINQLSTGGGIRYLGDDMKMIIIDSMRVLNMKFPSKYTVLLNFLFKTLSDEGSSVLKQNVVDTMIDIARSNAESTDGVLTHLAEFIDDCEFPHITKRVLMYLGEEVAGCENPKKYVRYVYNHATLDPAEIRAVAVTTLAKIAARVPALRRSIVILLKRSCLDCDDEVRDRALLYAKLFLLNDEEMIKTFVEDIASAVATQRMTKLMEKSNAAVQQQNIRNNNNNSASAAAAREQTAQSSAAGGLSTGVLQGRDELRRIKQLRQLGEPIRSSEAVTLTEADNEFVVSVMKHMYPEHIVLQYKVRNTMSDVTVAFRNVSVLTDTSELEAEPLYAIPVDTIAPGAVQFTYVVLQYTAGEYPSGSVECAFRFSMQESEEDEVGDAEEYPIESFDVDISDFIVPATLSSSDMQSSWEAAAAEETEGTYSLRAMRNLTAAANELVSFFGMHVDGGAPEKISTNSHTLFMAGRMTDGDRTLVLVQARVFIATDNSVALQLALRGGDADLREYLANALLS